MRILIIRSLLAIVTIPSFFISSGCKKHGSTPADTTPVHVGSPYYPGMGSVHNWSGHYHNTYSDPNVVNNYDVSGTYPDTTCAVMFIDTNTISLFNLSYKYSSSDSVKHIYYFGGGYYLSQGYAASEGVIYYYDNDSIIWGFHDYHNTWAYWNYDRVRHTN